MAERYMKGEKKNEAGKEGHAEAECKREDGNTTPAATWDSWSFDKDYSFPLRLHVLHLDQCDPRKCTAKTLKRFGLVRLHKSFRTIPLNSIKLNPFADKAISPSDAALIRRHGITVIDCSWKNAREIFQDMRLRNDRKIPVSFLAGNSINYAIPGKLSSVEAFSAALIVAGFLKEARYLLSKFKWGHTFWELNQELIESLGS